MFELLRPQAELYEAWNEAHREWGSGLHEDGFGIDSDDDVDTERGFRIWIDRLRLESAETWWVVEDGRVLAGIALRTSGDDRVERFGHVGYGVRPSARGRGVATWALGQVLAYAPSIGVDPVLAVCREDNTGSVATVEHFGATLLQTETHGSVRVRRYAIPARR